jgi:GDPmannose 4,6-dehydratase
MPSNLYGPNDNFDLDDAHVLPALIRKFHEARQSDVSEVVVWGSGTPKREFLHVDDLADACHFLLENYDDELPINIGTGHEVSIRELAEAVQTVVYPDARIVYDRQKPDGNPRRLLDVDRIHALGWQHSTQLIDGIRSTYNWYQQQLSGKDVSPSRSATPIFREPTDRATSETNDRENPMPNDKPKRALITGITGQDGSYLAELLLAKGYHVWGMVRRASLFNTQRIDHIYQDPHEEDVRLRLCYGDLGDASSINTIIKNIEPDEIYNLGAQSHVKVSFEVPEYTGDVTGLGMLRILEAVRGNGMSSRIYQASSSELFGKAVEIPQSESTPFYPRSPYAAAKAYAFHITRNYRESYGMFAVNGILFNHESPRRGPTFVTRKITRAAAAIAAGKQDRLYLGNLDAKRDWGFAGDYVRAMWLMLQADEPNDFVIATGSTHSVREFCSLAFERAGVPINWRGTGLDEKGVNADGDIVVEIDPRYFRPAEVEHLIGDATNAREQLGWQPEVDFAGLVNMMVDADVAEFDAHVNMTG